MGTMFGGWDRRPGSWLYCQLGEFESGVTAELMGVVPAVVAGGIGTLVIAAIWLRLFPELYAWGGDKNGENKNE